MEETSDYERQARCNITASERIHCEKLWKYEAEWKTPNLRFLLL